MCVALSFPFTIHTPAHIPFRPHPRSCRLGCVGGTVCRSNAWQHIWAGQYASCAVRKADLPTPTHPTTTLNPFSPNTYSFRPTCSRPTAGHTNNPCGRRPFRPDPIVMWYAFKHHTYLLNTFLRRGQPLFLTMLQSITGLAF